MNINDTLASRGARYGEIADNAKVTEALVAALRAAPYYETCSDVHKLCLYMICHKLGRIVCGDANYADNMHDIAGYAKLLEEYVSNEKL